MAQPGLGGAGVDGRRGVCPQVRTSVFVQLCLCGHVHVCSRRCANVHKSAYTHKCLCTCDLHVDACLCVHVHVSFVYNHVCMCLFVHTFAVCAHVLHMHAPGGARVSFCVCTTHVCIRLSLHVHVGTCLCLYTCLHGLFRLPPSPHVSQGGWVPGLGNASQ